MAQYRVLAKSFINNAIREEGETVEYDGKPGSNLELIEGDKPKSQKGRGSKGADASASQEQAGE